MLKVKEIPYFCMLKHAYRETYSYLNRYLFILNTVAEEQKKCSKQHLFKYLCIK